MADDIWQAKLAARIHDPAEKALVLLRDPAGHENGTSRALRRLLGLDTLPTDTIDPDNDAALSRVLFEKGLPVSIYRHVQRADWWAAAADRPQWPMLERLLPNGKTMALAEWAQVRWARNPVIVHPLTGQIFDLAKHGGLVYTDIDDIKQDSFNHFASLVAKLVVSEAAAPDWRKLLLAFWRFGPELSEDSDNGKLGALWHVLPADTRVPDHSIWDHLDLASAFAGAFAADPKGEAALLALSIGPVQPFIAAARKTEDLWAGSHLLSRLAWEVMKPVCERLGPDAVLFPRLRGIAQVDLWMRDEMQLPHELFKGCDWQQSATDANPLFAAALPNRFVAVVPASAAREIAHECERRVRDWLLAQGMTTVDRLLDTAGIRSKQMPRDESVPAYDQMREQLAGFPEVHWAAVPFSLIGCRDEAKQRDLDVDGLSAAMAPFFGVSAGKSCGFLDSPAWQVLRQDMDWGDGTTFYAPNPGVLYPAVYDLAERVLAAAKSTRAFDQTRQEGWRDSLTGEAEWLTTDRTQLERSYRQQANTLWARVARERPAWAKKGEHLGALSAIKRLWPDLFADEVGRALGTDESAARFVVSTHTMALAANLERLDQKLGEPGVAKRFERMLLDGDRAPALPRQLAKLRGTLAARIPAALDRLRESADEQQGGEQQLARIEGELNKALGHRPEAYYALLLMDGDRMGAILAGDETTGCTTSYLESLHPQVRQGFETHAARQPRINAYGHQKRSISPNRHLAISAALNDFSQILVRHVVEVEHRGRVIYAGGDDVLAMLPVADMMACTQRLRHAYSGEDPEHEGGVYRGLTLKAGFAALKTQSGGKERLRLMRMMGKCATASCGAVIAHHMAPLSAVMRELRAAEQRAKNEGRDRFSLTVIKRSGGALRLTAKWGEPLKLMGELRDFLATADTSRRAVYHSLQWLKNLPVHPAPDMLQCLLGYQFARQSGEVSRATDLSARLAKLALDQPDPRPWLTNFLTVAEFLARETRSGIAAPSPASATEGATA